MTTPVLEVEDLYVTYRMGSRSLPAIRGVDLRVERGEIVGILGESGCRKSTLGMTIPRLLPPNSSISGGRILLEGRDLTVLRDTEIRAVRGAQVGMIFQDPLTSLNPVFPIGAQMTAARRAHGTAQDDLPTPAQVGLHRGLLTVDAGDDDLAGLRGGLLADDHVVAVEDPGFDHRVTLDLHHEQLPRPGEVLRDRDRLLDALVGEKARTRGDIPQDEGDVPDERRSMAVPDEES